jgi:hypothetical protein
MKENLMSEGGKVARREHTRGGRPVGALGMRATVMGWEVNGGDKFEMRGRSMHWPITWMITFALPSEVAYRCDDLRLRMS